MNYALIASNWRKKQPEGHTKTGVVLIWQGKVYGWKNSLRDASHERPNAIAVDEQGRIFRAEGGNDDDGAKMWVVVSNNVKGGRVPS